MEKEIKTVLNKEITGKKKVDIKDLIIHVINKILFEMKNLLLVQRRNYKQR